MHECPHCGSQTITCRHCSWTWNPRDPENLPDTCPRCRNDWRKPFKWNVKSQFSHGTIDPHLGQASKFWEEYTKKKHKKVNELTDDEAYSISV